MDKTKAALDITPDTKVGTLLANYPHLENFLIEMSPVFARLRNPILQRTVAKVATLRQAAEIGGLPLATMINSLRKAAGLEETITGGETGSNNADKPDWIDFSAVAKSLDAGPILEKGEHPLGRVMNELKELEPGKIYELITPFIPAPLIDMAKGKGYLAWTKSEGSEKFLTYFKQK